MSYLFMTKERFEYNLKIITILLLSISLYGCATTNSLDERDPLEGFNRGVYSFNQTMDDLIFDPIGDLYRAITPDFIESGVTNFFNNLNDLSVIANEILQFKFGRASSDAARFVINSTVGLLGFFDVSSEMGLSKHNEDFGQTLAQWGFESGPYIVVPFFGPASLRDLSSFVVDKGVLNPMFYIEDDMIKSGLLTLNYVDFKSRLSSTKELVGTASLDEYEFIKNAYFEKRAYEINDGNVVDFIGE